MSAAVIARWSGFLAKIEERFEQILTETEEGCKALLAQCDDDPLPMTNAFTAMRTRIIGLEQKIDQTWSERVEDLFDDDALAETQRARGDALSRRMERERERLQVRVFADAARTIRDRALAERESTLLCPMCGGDNGVPEVYQSVNVQCRYCDAQVTWEPGPRMRMVAWFCVQHLAEEAASAEREALVEASERLSEARGRPPHLVEAVRAAHEAHWRAFLEAQARMLPDKAADLEKDLQGRMRGLRIS